MIVSTNNIADQATITVTPESALQDPAVLVDGDYSSVFTETLSGSIQIDFSFDNQTDVGYIALGGTNIGKKDAIKISASSGTEPTYLLTIGGDQLTTSDSSNLAASLQCSVDDSELGLLESPVLMYKTDIVGCRSITIIIEGTGQISIAEIAMGSYYEIPRGEQAGYNRPWSVPNVSARSTSGLNNAPINLSYESRALKCTLSVPNNLIADFDSWYEFINFAASNTFYVLEDSNKFHSYAGFNAVPAMTKAHSSTRSLGVSSIAFSAFAKSTEALF